MRRRLRAMLTAAAFSAAAFSASMPAFAQCSGCGCKGGPGYRGPNGQCVGWANIGKVCGSPPTARCAAEGPNKGANEAASHGAAIESARPH